MEDVREEGQLMAGYYRFNHKLFEAPYPLFLIFTLRT